MNRHKILIIEDNGDTRRFLQVMLAKEYDVLTAENGVQGLEIARNENPNMVLIDVVMPVLNGYDTCKILKEDARTSRIPVIFLSAKNSSADISFAFSVGADDFITKPFDYRELSARIKNRLSKSDTDREQVLQIGALRIETSKREVSYGGQIVHLTLTEFDILLCLATRRGTVVSRDEIMKHVWRDSASSTNDRTIDVHVRALRRKVPALTKHVQSIYGVGYKYDV